MTVIARHPPDALLAVWFLLWIAWWWFAMGWAMADLLWSLVKLCDRKGQ